MWGACPSGYSDRIPGIIGVRTLYRMIGWVPCIFVTQEFGLIQMADNAYLGKFPKSIEWCFRALARNRSFGAPMQSFDYVGR